MSTGVPAVGSRFHRLSGGGNDFLVFIEPDANPDSDTIRTLCRRGLSLGADGLIALRRTATGAQMEYWNADGTAGALCLNGTRCAAHLAFELGWAEDEGEVLTGAGTILARRAEGGGIELAVDPPRGEPSTVEAVVDGRSWVGHRVLIGVPHFVLVWPESVARAPVGELGPALRSAPEVGAAGANIDFVRFPARDRIELRTFERGVEAETLACGTGALAAAAVGLLLGKVDLPLEVLTLGGAFLRVAGEAEDGRPKRWTLAGDARRVAEGEIRPGALAAPSPPDWSA